MRACWGGASDGWGGRGGAFRSLGILGRPSRVSLAGPQRPVGPDLLGRDLAGFGAGHTGGVKAAFAAIGHRR